VIRNELNVTYNKEEKNEKENEAEFKIKKYHLCEEHAYENDLYFPPTKERKTTSKFQQTHTKTHNCLLHYENGRDTGILFNNLD
jgi:hypothetical protein